MIGLTGPTGAGKSTLLRAINRLIPISGGTVWLDGQTVSGLRGQGLRQRAACLQAFRRVLAALARELAFSLRPLDQLMAGAQEGSQGPVADFFRACRQAFAAGGRESWADSWATALEATPLPLTPEDRRLLREAGDVLGRYDGESQRAALEALLARLEDQGAQAQAEAHRLFRVYLALGVAAGLFCLILL